MNIGEKLKNARISANLTQEQAADSLSVSRQTISNWENSRTYPDIVSVIKISDLYNISLDDLLKEKKNTASEKEVKNMALKSNMSDYMDYLEESTNVVKSKNKFSKLILIITYLAIWTFAIIIFWFFTSGSDAFAYSLVFLWFLLPVTTFVISLLISRNNYWGRLKWLAAPILGIMYMLAEYATFSMANNVAFDKINPLSLGMILVGAVISLAGLGVGALARRIKHKKGRN